MLSCLQIQQISFSDLENLFFRFPFIYFFDLHLFSVFKLTSTEGKRSFHNWRRLGNIQRCRVAQDLIVCMGHIKIV